MHASWLALAAGCLLPAAAAAQTPRAPAASQPAARPVVVELFTSQGCSSCPPADAIVADLARTRPDLLPLTFHVTYWNSLGWRDPFSFAGATERQRHYVAQAVSPGVYTPAMVMDGRRDVVGSDRFAVAATLAQATADATTAAPVEVIRAGNALSVTIGAGSGHGTVLVLGCCTSTSLLPPERVSLSCCRRKPARSLGRRASPLVRPEASKARHHPRRGCSMASAPRPRPSEPGVRGAAGVIDLTQLQYVPALPARETSRALLRRHPGPGRRSAPGRCRAESPR